MLPLTEYLQSSTGPSFGGKVVRHQVLGSGCDNQSASAMAQMGHNKVAGQHDLMLEYEASLRKGPNLSVKANEQSKSVSLPAPLLIFCQAVKLLRWSLKFNSNLPVMTLR